VHSPTEDKCDDTKDSFYVEIQKIFSQFPKHHTKILFGDFNAKVGKKDIFKPTIGNESLHKNCNDYGVNSKLSHIKKSSYQEYNILVLQNS
jgi:hypothetical protein